MMFGTAMYGKLAISGALVKIYAPLSEDSESLPEL